MSGMSSKYEVPADEIASFEDVFQVLEMSHSRSTSDDSIDIIVCDPDFSVAHRTRRRIPSADTSLVTLIRRIYFLVDAEALDRQSLTRAVRPIWILTQLPEMESEHAMVIDRAVQLSRNALMGAEERITNRAQKACDDMVRMILNRAWETESK